VFHTSTSARHVENKTTKRLLRFLNFSIHLSDSTLVLYIVFSCDLGYMSNHRRIKSISDPSDTLFSSHSWQHLGAYLSALRTYVYLQGLLYPDTQYFGTR
jgi:hypothetical protein